MTLCRKRSRALAVLGVAGTILLALTSGATAKTTKADRHPHDPPPLGGMRVLLTNDDSMRMARPDGSDGQGLYELRRALCAAGADVVVTAPWANQSGASTSVNTGTALTVHQRTTLPPAYAGDCANAPSGGAVYGVCQGTSPCGPDTPSATPADTVRLALGGGLAALVGWQDGPDVVVSGANTGPNVASVVNYSGTVGAALAAIDSGVPALAVNAGMDPATLRVADRTYRDAAAFAADFLGDLRHHDLLSTRFVININHPHLAKNQRPKDTAWAPVGTRKVLHISYTNAGNTFTFNGGLCRPSTPGCRPETKPRADFTLLRQDHVTITPITLDRTFRGAEARRLEWFVRLR